MVLKDKSYFLFFKRLFSLVVIFIERENSGWKERKVVFYCLCFFNVKNKLLKGSGGWGEFNWCFIRIRLNDFLMN